jgi:tetratricopeptide (TPR) repeat protein
VVGVLAGFGIRLYGAGAAAGVALSDAETLADKAGDAVNPVDILNERYDTAMSLVENGPKIEKALNYVNQNTPKQGELESALDASSETLNKIGTTYDEVSKAREALDDIDRRDARTWLDGVDEAFGHANNAFNARPDADSLRELGDRAEQAAPFVAQVRVLSGDYLEDLLHVVDNFSRDEIAATLGVMAAALALTSLLGQAVGFWARRGRPRFLARTLQRWGARVFRRWYVSNLRYALSPPLYAAARERLQRDIVADPKEALDPAVFRDLEAWFVNRSFPPVQAHRDRPGPAQRPRP